MFYAAMLVHLEIAVASELSPLREFCLQSGALVRWLWNILA